jgi:molecular chaperone GrpE
MTDIKEINDLHDDLETVEEVQDSFEDTALEEDEEHSKDTIKKLKVKLKEVEKEKMEVLETLQRTKAEFLNARKRLEEEKLVDRERAVDKHIEKLLPLCDSFYMAQSNKAAWENIDETWKKGIESIQNQLQSLLYSYEVTQVHPVGEVFDPVSHEALMHVPVVKKEEDGMVVAVIQNGFMRTHNGKTHIIRPARVSVGQFTDN